MRILMLGNSFTYYNGLPDTLAGLTGAEVEAHTRGGAELQEHLNPDTELGALTQRALKEEKWDYVVLQEYSSGPVLEKEKYLESVRALCAQIRRNGAVPVIYATWAYEKGSARMDSMAPMTWEEMDSGLYEACHEAAEENDALIADVGKRFHELAEEKDLYVSDGLHPNEEGSRIAAEILSEVILKDSRKRPDSRLRVLYLYQILLKCSDENHLLSTQDIIRMMWEKYGIHMIHTTVRKDVDVLNRAGIEVMIYHENGLSNYYCLADRVFSTPELKILIDAVQSSRFLTERKSGELIDKLASLASISSADEMKRSVNIPDRAKSDNEKGYYIVDAIHAAINAEEKISFRYFYYDTEKNRVLKNGGEPYTVSPYDLIWDGDFYYLTGYCDERKGVRTFRVDRILEQPEPLPEKAVPKPADYSVRNYTQETFRMFSSEEAVQVTLYCREAAMNSIIDQFGLEADTEPAEEEGCFRARVSVRPGPTFYRWVFGWGGQIRIEGPEEIREEYVRMLREVLDSQG